MESSRWSWTRWRPFILGALGTLTVLLLVLLLTGAWILWVRAYHGQQAYELLDSLQRQQQQQLQSPHPAPTPKPGG